MVKEENWSEKYFASDHHADRQLFNKIHFESKVGGLLYPDPKDFKDRLKRAVKTSQNPADIYQLPYLEERNRIPTSCHRKYSYLPTICEDTEHQSSLVMARGRGGYDLTIKKKRAQSVPVGDAFEPSQYGKSSYISRAAIDDMDSVSSASKKSDQKLLDDITSRLCKFEFDCVKPGREVASRTGFRRHLYGKKPLVERETRTQRRKEELMYPWDYTFENIYRPREKRPWCKKKEKKEPPKKSKWDDIPEPAPENHYPDQYPYKARVKKERKDPNSITLTGKRFENMPTHEILAKMKGKLEAKPRGRSLGVDVDILLEGMHAPLPRSYVKGQAFAAADDWSPNDADIDMDPIVSKKITDSKKELADFEMMLENRFKRRRDCFVSRVPPKPTPPPRQQTPTPEEDDEKIAQIEVNASFTQPVTVKRSRGRPVTREPAYRPAAAPSTPALHRLPRSVRNIITSTDDEFEFPAFPKYKSAGSGRFAGRSAAAAERRRAASVPPPSTRPTPTKVYDPRNDFITLGSPLMKPAGPTPEERKLGDFKASLQYRFFMPDFLDDDTETPPPRKQAKRSSNTYNYTTSKKKASAPSSYRSSYSWRASSEPPIRPPPRPVYAATSFGTATASRPSGLSPSADLAVRQARATLGRLEREWGYDDDLDAGYTTPITHVPAAGRYRSTVQYGAAPASPAPARARTYRSSSVCYGSPVTARRSRAADIELKLAMATAEDLPSPDLQKLRSLHLGAKDKMDRFKTSLDRYLPVYMGPINDVPVEVEYKYDELKNRMPSLEPYRAGGSSLGTTYVPPYKPASLSQQDRLPRYPSDGRPPAWRPKISDTRKRCREVLAKSKGDPGYYDY